MPSPHKKQAVRKTAAGSIAIAEEEEEEEEQQQVFAVVSGTLDHSGPDEGEDEGGSDEGSEEEEENEEEEEEEEEDGGEDSSSEEEAENVGVAMSLPKRGTRGKRFHAMVAEEAEADAAFWGQAAFQEAEEEDVDYVKTPDESADEVDSDFDIDETEVEVQETVKPGDDKQANSKAYKEPVRKRRQVAKTKLTAAERQERKRQRREYLRAAAANRVMRRSTKNKTAAIAEAAAVEAEARRRARANRKKTKSHSRTAPITADGVVLEQKDMLMDAVRTEMANIDSLRKMKQQHLDDKVVVQRKEASGTLFSRGRPLRGKVLVLTMFFPLLFGAEC